MGYTHKLAISKYQSMDIIYMFHPLHTNLRGVMAATTEVWPGRQSRSPAREPLVTPLRSRGSPGCSASVAILSAGSLTAAPGLSHLPRTGEIRSICELLVEGGERCLKGAGGHQTTRGAKRKFRRVTAPRACLSSPMVVLYWVM